jgi:hypothetical protein
MTPQEFLDLSTKLFKDMKLWSEQATADAVVSPSDLALLKSAMAVVERATLKDVEGQMPSIGPIA